MQIEDLDARWHALSDEVITQMKGWRIQHPRATFQEIETALDERLARLRARMLEDTALEPGGGFEYGKRTGTSGLSAVWDTNGAAGTSAPRTPHQP